MTTHTVRQGSVYKRCGKCGRTLAAKTPKRCPKCGASLTTKANITWSWRLDVAPRGEKRKVRSGHGYATDGAARTDLDALRTTITDGAYVEKRPDLLRVYLQAWLDGIRHEVSAGTWASYEGHVRNYIAPRIGDHRLQDVTRTAIRKMLGELRESGRVRGEGGLSPKTVQNVFLTLHVALEAAVKDRLLPRNPADDAFKMGKDDINPDTVDRSDGWWNKEQMDAFLAHVAGDEFYAMWQVVLWTGARRGEVAGMRWDDLDLDAEVWRLSRQWRKGRDGRPEIATLKAAKPGKLGSQKRDIALLPDTVEALRRHRSDQAKMKLLHGQAYDDHGLVFCQPNGEPLHPDGITQRWDRHVRSMERCAACDSELPSRGYTCRECGLDLAERDRDGRPTGLRDDAYTGQPTMRLHDARHSHLTWCVKNGMGLLETCLRAGHADIQTTARYLHSNIDSQQAALRAAIKRAAE